MEHQLLSSDPLWRRSLRRRRGGFRTVDLNIVGWSALIGAGLVLGTIAVAVTPLRAALALPAGVVGVWIVLLILDHIRWRNSKIAMGRSGLDATTGASIVAHLETLGIVAMYREELDEDDGENDMQRSIVCRHADAMKVRAVMDDRLSQRS